LKFLTKILIVLPFDARAVLIAVK